MSEWQSQILNQVSLIPKILCFTTMELPFPKIKMQHWNGRVGSAKIFGFYFAWYEKQCKDFRLFFFKSLFKNWIMAILEDGIPRRKTFYLERDIIEAWTKRVEVGTDKDEAYELFKIKRVRLDDWYIKWGRKMLKVIRSVGLWITCTVMPLTEDYWKRNGFESKKKMKSD